MERTLLVIKPDVTARATEIIARLKQAGYRIIQASARLTRAMRDDDDEQKRSVQLSEEQATDFYQEEMDQGGFAQLVAFIISGPVFAMVIEKQNLFDDIPAFVGPRSPDIGRTLNPDCLRAVFGKDELRNGIHYSEDPVTARREINFFFPDNIIDPLPSMEHAKLFLESAIYPTLLQGLTELCKEKPANPTAPPEAAMPQKSLSAHSLKSLDGPEQPAGAGAAGGADDWLPPKVLLKPPGQLQLSEKELDEEFTRILNANNPHAPQNIARYNNKERMFKASPNMEHIVFHFEFDGYLIYRGDEGGENKIEVAVDSAPKAVSSSTQQAEADGGEDEKKTSRGPLRNQFNFSERAAQTVNNPYRERSTNTEPPPQRTYSMNVNQWTIFDTYSEDLQQKEKAAKEKSKAPAPGGTKGHKDEDKGASMASDAHGEDVYYKNLELRKALITIERMANQNTFDDISQDYKYWEDASDELGDRKSGTLLPLWKFAFEKDKKKQVTALCWNPQSPDLFAVGYGSYDFSRQGPGMIAIFTLKNPSHPEYVYITETGVMSLHFHPQHPSMIAVGLYDGSVLVYNIQKKVDSPIFKSTTKGGRHTDPVWQVCWQKDDLDDNLNFFSVSSDGRVTQWTLLKNELLHTDVIALKYDNGEHGQNGAEDERLFSLAGGCCFDFHKRVEHLFTVGTEEGKIYKCSKDYNSQYLLSFEGHQMAVYTVRYNPFHVNYFLSASADWTVKLWDHNDSKPAMVFDLNGSVGDVAWAPYSSTVFAAVTAEGKVFVFDLNENKYAPICEQQVVRKAKLTHISFNQFEPIILVGDDKGTVVSLKLSPNLRRKSQTPEEEPQKLENVINLAKGKPLTM
nr:cytoplasmic dynein with WD40 domain [Polyrhizophydium stewartii]